MQTHIRRVTSLILLGSILLSFAAWNADMNAFPSAQSFSLTKTDTVIGTVKVGLTQTVVNGSDCMIFVRKYADATVTDTGCVPAMQTSNPGVDIDRVVPSLVSIAIVVVILVSLVAIGLLVRSRRHPAGVSQASSVFCTQCGAENPATNEFCGKCGERLVEGST